MDVNFTIFTGNLSSTKFKFLKFYKACCGNTLEAHGVITRDPRNKIAKILRRFG